MKATAICAAVLVAVVIACQLPAQGPDSGPRQPGPTTDQIQPGNAIDFAAPIVGQSDIEVKGGAARRRPEAYRRDIEQRVAALWTEFGKALGVAIQDEVINPEQAGRMLKELEAEIAIRRARLELLRAVAILDKAAGDSPQSEEFHRLRQQLDEVGLRLRDMPPRPRGTKNTTSGASPSRGGYNQSAE